MTAQGRCRLTQIITSGTRTPLFVLGNGVPSNSYCVWFGNAQEICCNELLTLELDIEPYNILKFCNGSKLLTLHILARSSQKQKA